jgi:hypothetical protein
MAIPITAGLKILLSERLQARDAADTDAAAPGDGQIAAPDSLAPPPHRRPRARRRP